MTKRQYIIAVFKKLQPYWSTVSEYITLIQNPSCTDQDVEDIFFILEAHIHNIQDSELRSKIQQMFDIIKAIHTREQISIQQDLNDIDAMLAGLNQM